MLKQHIFTVSSSMGQMAYTVITDCPEYALDEVRRFFFQDPKFTINQLDRLNSYQDNEAEKAKKDTKK